LDDEECADLLETLNESGLADQRPLPLLIGMAADADSFWADLRVGELKTLLALAIGDKEATLEGCEWVRHFDQLDPKRRIVYACIENLLQLSEIGKPAAFLDSLRLLYGADVLKQAQTLIAKKNRFMGLSAPGLSMQGCEMHQKLLVAYDKLHARKTAN
jgi:ribosomal protein S12 methylthiotransferase accessory factor